MSIGFSEHGLKMHMEDMIMEKEEEEKEAFLVLSSNELASKQPQEYKKLLCLLQFSPSSNTFATFSLLVKFDITSCLKITQNASFDKLA